MKKLDLVKINSCAPYAVKEDTQEGAYTFIADSGAEFSKGQSYSHSNCRGILQCQ